MEYKARKFYQDEEVAESYDSTRHKGKNLRQIIEEYETLPDLIILLILQQILRGFVYFL